MYLKILIRENIILREKGKLGSNHIVNFLQGHMAPQEKIGKEKVNREASFKSVNLTSAIRALPGLRRRQDETLHQENQARGVAGDLAKSVHKLKKKDKAKD